MSNGNCEQHHALGRLSTPARNHYFYGKMMDVNHFVLEQQYHIDMRRLLNRLGLGYGVLSGLGVKVVAGNGAETNCIRVCPGVAIDRLGREIIVPTMSRPINPWQLTNEWGRPAGGTNNGQKVLVCLAYHECPEEPTSVLVGDCETEQGYAPSIICERYRVLVLSREDFAGEHYCCPGSDLLDTSDTACNGGSAGLTPESHRQLAEYVASLEPNWEPRDEGSRPVCVPLALVTLPGSNGSLQQTDIDLSVRPLVFSSELLFRLLLCRGEPDTHVVPQPPQITEISWAHGGEMDSSVFGSGLTISFSEEVEATCKPESAWFIVMLRTKGDLEGTEMDLVVGAKSISITDRTVTFKPVDLVNWLNQNQTGALCRVILKCNFLRGKTVDDVDCLSVDGDFFGVFPTGDGIPGGDFESWFMLNPC